MHSFGIIVLMLEVYSAFGVSLSYKLGLGAKTIFLLF